MSDSPLQDPAVAIIVPQFGRCELTLRCVQSFRTAHGLQARVLVVDDGSSCSDLEPHRHRLTAEADLLEQPHRGLTATWNAGLHAVRSRWLVFLNNDTVTHGPWLDALLAPLVSGRALLTGVGWRRERHLPAAPAATASEPRFLVGWCFAIARQTLIALDGFDETLALYFSDTDLQLRLSSHERATPPRLCVEGLPLRHAGHATAHRLPDQRRQWRRDRDRFREKWSITSGGRPEESERVVVPDRPALHPARNAVPACRD